MKTWTIVCLAMCMSIALGACTGGGASTSEPASTDSAAPATPEPASSTDAAPVTPAPASADSAATTTEPATEPAAAAPETAASASNGLIGTTWKVGPFMAHFKDATTVHVSGGEPTVQMPDGIDAVYVMKDGTIEVTVLNGIVKKGTWDGSSLVIDGIVGEKQP